MGRTFPETKSSAALDRRRAGIPGERAAGFQCVLGRLAVWLAETPRFRSSCRAADLFAVQPVHEKQGFLRLILKSATWREGELQTEFQQPFENLRRSNQLSNTKHKENGATNAEIDIWLPRQDSNLEPFD